MSILMDFLLYSALNSIMVGQIYSITSFPSLRESSHDKNSLMSHDHLWFLAIGLIDLTTVDHNA